MRHNVVVTKVLKAIEQSALGVMTLEPMLNQGPNAASYRHERAECLRFPRKTAQIVIETTATVALETSNDGVNWIEQGNISASGELVNDEPWAYARLNVTAWTAGAVSGTLALSE